MALLFPLYSLLVEIWSPQRTPQICQKTTSGASNWLCDYAYLWRRREEALSMRIIVEDIFIPRLPRSRTPHIAVKQSSCGFSALRHHSSRKLAMQLPSADAKKPWLHQKGKIRLKVTTAMVLRIAHGSTLLTEVQRLLKHPNKQEFLANAVKTFSGLRGSHKQKNRHKSQHSYCAEGSPWEKPE